MASVHMPPSVPIEANVATVEEQGSSDSDDPENIPYHARENARPFTYGNLPVGFSTSELNHVAIEELADTPRETQRRQQSAYPPSPSTMRKSTRPSISPSRPVLRKTPSRQEFEEMLMERKEQALREQNNAATKLAQNAAIQKDLDELHERLNRTVLSAERARGIPMVGIQPASAGDVITHMESIDLPDAAKSLSTSPSLEPALQLVEAKRSETPSFPVTPRPNNSERCVSPYPATSARSQQAITFDVDEQSASPEHLAKPARRQDAQVDWISHTQEVEPHLVKFAKDSSEFWYKPHMTREEAVDLLRNVRPGTFLIRNSTTYQDAYGLVLRVARPPPGVIGSGNGDELVRHFLLEPTTRGVRLKGCTNEPIFTSLSAFVYQHSINQLALPCVLNIPDRDLLLSSNDEELIARQKQVLQQGAACNVLYLFQFDTESLTGDEAVRKAVLEMGAQSQWAAPVEVHFKVSQQGITLTDNTRKLFFRRHYTPQNVSHFAMDPDQRTWSVVASDEGLQRPVNKSIFAFVARPLCGSRDNQCHVFCDLAASQPASAIVSFANKVLPLDKSSHKML